MMPLKATVPLMVYVDKTTGNTEIVSALNERQVGYQDLNDKYWARKYVTARESYFYTLLQADYETVLALSNDDVGTVYDKGFAGENAKQVKLGTSIEEKVNVLSVVLPAGDPGKAVVRFEKTQRRVNTQDAGPPQTYVASLAFKYEPSMLGRERDLINNPLGFKVTAYRVDAEIASPGGQR
jgi:type IV secretion system protein VirB8